MWLFGGRCSECLAIWCVEVFVLWARMLLFSFKLFFFFFLLCWNLGTSYFTLNSTYLYVFCRNPVEPALGMGIHLHFWRRVTPIEEAFKASQRVCWYSQKSEGKGRPSRPTAMPFGLKLRRTRRYNVLSKNCFVTRIRLLDNNVIECTLSVESTGQECLEAVAQRLELREVRVTQERPSVTL